MTQPTATLREGSVADLPEIMTLFDDAVTWLAANGRSAQWGSEPWSTDEAKVGFVRKLMDSGTTIIAESGGIVVGAAIYGPERMPYVPAVEEPEIYISLLITSQSVRRVGVGTALLEAIRNSTRELGIPLLRVHCWSGGDRKLISYYEGQGFTPTIDVPVKDTSVQVFEQRLERN